MDGFPQGAAISPLLSILSIRHMQEILRKETGDPALRLVMYADDGVIYSHRPLSYEVVNRAFQERGLEVEPDKSKEVVDELKFLGFRLSPQGFQSETRNGVKMLISKDEIANLDWAMALKAIQKEVAEWEESSAPQAISEVPPHPSTANRKATMTIPQYSQMLPTLFYDGGQASPPLPPPVSISEVHLESLWDREYTNMIEDMFNEQKVLRQYLKFPHDKTFDWEESIKQEIEGLILSRLYVGKWNDLTEGSRDLKYSQASFTAQAGRASPGVTVSKHELTLLNASSLSWHVALPHLTRERTHGSKRAS